MVTGMPGHNRKRKVKRIPHTETFCSCGAKAVIFYADNPAQCEKCSFEDDWRRVKQARAEIEAGEGLILDPNDIKNKNDFSRVIDERR